MQSSSPNPSPNLEVHSPIALILTRPQVGDQTLTRKEFRRGVEYILKGEKVTKKEINDFFDELDVDKDGTVDVAEMETFFASEKLLAEYLQRKGRSSDGLTDGMTAEEAEANDLIPETQDDSPQPTRAPQGRGGATSKVAPEQGAPAEEAPARLLRSRTSFLRGRTPQNMNSSAAKRLSSETRKQIRKDYINKAAEDLDMGPVDAFKTFMLFPVLAKLQYADHIARVIFPVAFAIFLFSAFAEADWFGPHYDLLRSSKCYSRYS